MARRKAHRSRRHRSSRKPRSMRRARRTQNRTRSRASTKGYRKLKSRGRTKIKRSTFFKLRRKARNPGMSRMLKDGTQVTLDESGKGGIVRAFSASGELLFDKSLSWDKAVARFRKYKSGKRFGARQERDDYAMLAADNPRRGRGKKRRNCGRGMNPRRKGRKSKARRNPAQFPMPFASAFLNPRRRNAPISKSDARAMARVLRRHGHKHCRA